MYALVSIKLVKIRFSKLGLVICYAGLTLSIDFHWPNHLCIVYHEFLLGNYLADHLI